jgi:hypothetical protein
MDSVLRRWTSAAAGNGESGSGQPIWTVPQGIKEVWSDAGERGLTTEDFEGPQYVQLKRIQQLADERRLDLSDLQLR